MTVREEVKRVMGERGMTAYRLSEQSGIDQGLLSRYFARKSEVSVKTLEKILDVLGCELAVRER
jgi:transcriptional regulator with XRE-family HTH domain